MPPRKPKGKYAGDLASPIVDRPPGLLASEEAVSTHETAIFVEELRRLELLRKYYSIPEEPGEWFALSLALARDHVPGFRRVSPPGRKSTSSDPLGLIAAYVFICVERLRSDDSRLTIAEAAVRLSRISPWKEGRKTPEVIRTLYFKGRRSRALPILRDAMAWDEVQGTQGETEALIASMIRDP